MGGQVIVCLKRTVFATLKYRSYEHLSFDGDNVYYPYDRDVNVLECEILNAARANRWKDRWTDTIWDKEDYEALPLLDWDLDKVRESIVGEYEGEGYDSFLHNGDEGYSRISCCLSELMLEGLVVRGQPNEHGEETFRAASKVASCKPTSPYVVDYDDYIAEDMGDALAEKREEFNRLMDRMLRLSKGVDVDIDAGINIMNQAVAQMDRANTIRRGNITRRNFARAPKSVARAPPPPRRAYIVEFTHDVHIGDLSDMWNDEDGKSISRHYPDEQKEREEWDWYDAGYCFVEESRPKVYNSWASAKRAALAFFIDECGEEYWLRDEDAIEDMKREVPYDIPDWEDDEEYKLKRVARMHYEGGCEAPGEPSVKNMFGYAYTWKQKPNGHFMHARVKVNVREVDPDAPFESLEPPPKKQIPANKRAPTKSAKNKKKPNNEEPRVSQASGPERADVQRIVRIAAGLEQPEDDPWGHIYPPPG